MTDYVVIYERNADGWWAYLPDLPGCTAAGEDRVEVERNVREVVVAHLELLRSTGRPIPEPAARDAGRIAV
jgi:predicted RNase H-like HicB family nuclease